MPVEPAIDSMSHLSQALSGLSSVGVLSRYCYQAIFVIHLIENSMHCCVGAG